MLNNLFRVGWTQQNADTISYMLTLLVSLQQGNVRKSETSMKIVNTERENFHFFWTTWGISMKSLGKTWLMIILKATRKQGFNLSMKNTFL